VAQDKIASCATKTNHYMENLPQGQAEHQKIVMEEISTKINLLVIHQDQFAYFARQRKRPGFELGAKIANRIHDLGSPELNAGTLRVLQNQDCS
jgi:hypothetical protein